MKRGLSGHSVYSTHARTMMKEEFGNIRQDGEGREGSTRSHTLYSSFIFSSVFLASTRAFLVAAKGDTI